jgi:PhnB protein
MINPLPEGTQPLIPYMIMHDCAKAMEFYKKVFMAEEIARMPSPDGKKIMHAEMRISGCMVYMGDESPEMNAKSPKGMKHHSISMTMYCMDADKVFQRCVKHGSTVVRKMELQFWGDKMGTIVDPFGHQWTLMQRVEELTPAQIRERGKKAMAGKA